MPNRQAERQLTEFIAKFSPEMATLIRTARAKMRGFMPQDLELVYDNDNFFVIGYGPSEKAGDAIFSLAAQAKGLSLCFLQGAKLPDPHHLLRGSGNVVRNIRLGSPDATATTIRDCQEEMTAGSYTRTNRIDSLIIDPRHKGPNTSGNGGWVAGSLARLLGTEPVSVSLRAPAPLDRPLSVRWRDDGTVTLENDGTLIAEAARAPLELDVPKAPNPEEASAAGILAQKMTEHLGANVPYAHCFGCGLARSDGLRIVPGPVGDDGIVATSWTPVEGNGDQLSVETTWTALDCSAGFAWMPRLPAGTAIVTARITAVIDQPLQAGHRYSVIGWPIAQEGRKLHAGTAIFDASGKVRARSRQLWLIQRA